jgi:DNA polymerase-3 subunit alpha
VDEREAEEIFDLIKTFGRYGFNKSHSTAYALLAFQTAYLKVHYPLHYFASLLSGELNDTDKIAMYINEAMEMNIDVSAPDVNCGGSEFTVDGDSICYALSALKNVGEGAARVIAEERLNGEYESLFDFTSRVDLRVVNRRVIESLIKSGAADSLGENKRTLFENIDRAMEYGASIQGDRIKGQTSLFEEAGMESISGDICKMESFEEWTEAEISEYEKEVLGFYFRAHPVEKYRDVAERYGAETVSRLRNISDESYVSIFGITVTLKKIITRDNKEMAFVTLGDPTGSIEIVVFPNVFEKYKEFLESKAVIVVSGRVNGGKILADKIMNPEDFKKEASSQMHILLNSSTDFEQLVKLRDIFLKNKGKCNVFIHVPELERYKKAIKASSFLLVDPGEELISTLKREKLVEKVWVS